MGDVNTIAGIDAISGGPPLTGCSFRGCVVSPTAIWSSCSFILVNLLNSESVSICISPDDLGGCVTELVASMADFSPRVSCDKVSFSDCIFGEGVLTSGRVGGISTIGDDGIETPTLRLLGVVGEEEPEVCGDSNFIGWDRLRSDGGNGFGRVSDPDICGVVGQL